MSETRVSSEFSARIFNDDTGDFIMVGPDGDALDLCQIEKHEKGGPTITMIIEWETAEALARAILKLREIDPG